MLRLATAGNTGRAMCRPVTVASPYAYWEAHLNGATSRSSLDLAAPARDRFESLAGVPFEQIVRLVKKKVLHGTAVVKSGAGGLAGGS